LNHRLLVMSGAAIVASVASIAAAVGTSAAAPALPPCTLSGAGHVQICPVRFKATAGKSKSVVVARYADFSHCDRPAPSSEPGENYNYVVKYLTINWGDGTRPTSGVAHTGHSCPGSPYPDGANEPVTGVHRYKKKGTYSVSVTLTYVRGPGDTFQNCATATRGDTTYNNLSNCIALNAPVTSTGTVVKKK
jgi:hypothetical protein